MSSVVSLGVSILHLVGRRTGEKDIVTSRGGAQSPCSLVTPMGLIWHAYIPVTQEKRGQTIGPLFSSLHWES